MVNKIHSLHDSRFWVRILKIRTHGVRDRWRNVLQLVMLFVTVFWMFFTMRYAIMGWTIVFGLAFVAWSVLRARIDRRRRIAVRSGILGPAADLGGGRPGWRRDDPTRVLLGLALLFTILFGMFLAMRHDAAAWPLVFGSAFAGFWALRFAGRRRRRIAARLAAA